MGPVIMRGLVAIIRLCDNGMITGSVLTDRFSSSCGIRVFDESLPTDDFPVRSSIRRLSEIRISLPSQWPLSVLNTKIVQSKRLPWPNPRLRLWCSVDIFQMQERLTPARACSTLTRMRASFRSFVSQRL